MTKVHTFILALATTVAAAAVPAAAQRAVDPDLPVLADFARRVQAYVDLKNAAALTVLPLVTLDDPAEIRRRREALATVIQSARWNARQGELFTPAVVPLIRRAIRSGCDGDYSLQLALAREELTGPVPEPTVHSRWPEGMPLPTMLPGILAALPPLPANLEYRFMNRTLVLLDIDANLILDFVPEAIVITTETDHAH
jgi:hypothetical protein